MAVKIISWKDLTTKAIKLGYDIDDIITTLRYRFGKGGGHTEEYDKWYDYLERQMIVRQKKTITEEWKELVHKHRLKLEKSEGLNPGLSVEKMRECLERYKIRAVNEKNV